MSNITKKRSTRQKLVNPIKITGVHSNKFSLFADDATRQACMKFILSNIDDELYVDFFKTEATCKEEVEAFREQIAKCNF